MSTRSYSTVSGFFVQDGINREPSTTDDKECPTITRAVLPRFGLINERSDRWSTFIADIARLNATAEPGVQFKVFFLGRHGEGYHNVAYEKYGFGPWTEHWSKLNGDDEIVWGPDARLTPLGERQAQDAHAIWADERRFGIPLPEKLYTSPLTRAIRTNQVTFGYSLFPSGSKTTVVENMRERNGIYTCDQRQMRSDIHTAYPECDFEEGFTEKDELWTPDYRETLDDVDRRARTVLNKIFDSDTEQFISITSHARFIGSVLRICGRHPLFLPTGGILPIIVKGTIRQSQKDSCGVRGKPVAHLLRLQFATSISNGVVISQSQGLDRIGNAREWKSRNFEERALLEEDDSNHKGIVSTGDTVS